MLSYFSSNLLILLIASIISIFEKHAPLAMQLQTYFVYGDLMKIPCFVGQQINVEVTQAFTQHKRFARLKSI